ncbi:branched chain amino acid ABC transporter substrate-binding protein [Acidocella aquatica]|uniref:Branched chain amino acid ABC transporter substrate-binding protein n=2 Tax=Acidocella aquatica TaxID=1922313 RepID=A0ABQ6A1P9_9PROT|nr:branched chain amino acid ABC transporter substrate-binding protein [Acidocella aquatica]
MSYLTRRFLLASLSTSLIAGRARAAAPQAQPPAPAVTGVVLPLSGDLSLIGDECLRGIHLAAGAVNAAGGIAGKEVALVAADAVDQSHVAAAVNGVIGGGHAGVVLGTGASALSYPGSAAAELAQVPYIELNAPADGLTARGFKFLLRTGPTTSMIGGLAVGAIQSRFAGRKIGLLFNTGATGGAIAAGVIAALGNAKIPVLLAIGYPEDVTDLYDPVGRFMRAGVELVLHAGGPADVLGFYLAMQEQGWRPGAVIGCGNGYMLRETADALGAAFDGTLVIGAPFYPAAAAPIAQAYQAKYGTPPRGADSLTAYVGAKLVFDTLNAQGGSADKLLDVLRKVDIPAGGLANGFGVAFDASGQNTRSFVTLQRWRGSQLTPV